MLPEKENDVTLEKGDETKLIQKYENDIWSFLPHSSPYQYTIVMIMAYIGFTNALVAYWPTFVQYTPPFRCGSLLDELPFAQNATFDTMHNLVATKITKEQGNKFGYRQCEMIDISDVVTKCASNDIELCLSQAKNLSDITCDQFVYNYGHVNNRTAWNGSPWGSVIGDLNLVCSKSNLDKILLQATMVGLFFAGIIAGALTDTYGRKNTALLCMAMIAVSTLIPAIFLRMIPNDQFVLKFSILFICRVVMQAFEHCGWIAGTIYCLEMGGPSKRALFGCFFHYWYGIGWVSTSAIGYYFPDWVDYSLVLVLFTVVLALALCYIPPSIVYLFNARKYEQAQKALENLAERLDVNIPSGFVKEYIASVENDRAGKKNESGYTMMDLIRTRRIRNIFIMTNIIYMATVMLYYSQSLNSAALPGSFYVNNAMNGVSNILATAICSILLVYYNRRTILSGSLFLISISCFSSMLLQRIGEHYENDYSNAFIQTGRWISFVGMGGAVAAFVVIFIYFGELYPTNLRGMYFGLVAVISRIGGVLAPEFIQLEKENKNDLLVKSIPMITFSIVALIAGILCLLLPRTKDMPLLQTMTEANELYKKNEERLDFKNLFQFSTTFFN